MRTLWLGVVTAVLVSAGGSSAIDPGPAKIRIEAVVTSKAARHGASYSRQSLYNRAIQSKPIGFAVLACRIAIGATSLCQGTYSLPHGRIDVQGLVGNLSVYTLSVIGGTGTYQNTGGQLDVIALEPRTFRLIFSLRGF